MTNRRLGRIGLMIVCVLASLASASCSQQNSEAPKNLLEGQKESMEKARAIEDQLKKANDEQKILIEEQSR